MNVVDTKQYKWYTDPGHAWLQVPKAVLKELGIQHKISGYSYMKDADAYLEEDCDAGIFVDACAAYFGVDAAGLYQSLGSGKHSDNYSDQGSPVRNYESYKEAQNV